MPTEAENICCLEIPQVRSRLQEVDEVLCMTQHPGFHPVCLNVYTLQMAGHVLRAEYGPPRLKRKHRWCRHLAYRTFAGWCWGYLGRRIRVIIPACVVLCIRRKFPEDEVHYAGFRLSLN
ncbi:P2X purinoceptor 7-like [Antennarius striatus]|uniref:P2X purinoceptor 7-like n=1 Tax=Antennarius striatus TaxID=241820 RepID=UPI0035AEC679